MANYTVSTGGQQELFLTYWLAQTGEAKATMAQRLFDRALAELKKEDVRELTIAQKKALKPLLAGRG